MKSINRSIFESVVGRLHELQIDQIKELLNPLLRRFSIQCPVFNPEAFLYRGRRITSTFNKDVGIKKKDLTYPPREQALIGRLNRPGQPAFYCSMTKAPVLFEIPDLDVGAEIILTFWKTNSQMLLNNIGYTDFVFKEIGAKRLRPQWGAQISSESAEEKISLQEIPEEELKKIKSADEFCEERELFSEFFARKIGGDEKYLYKLTVAIGELHLGPIQNRETQFAGVLYPSIRMWANADNVALLPWYVDKHLDFRKAVHIRIKSKSGSSISIEKLDAASEFDNTGKLRWLGRLPNWTVPPRGALTMTPVEGPDEDGDYDEGNGRAAHWTAVDPATGMRVFPR